MCFIEQGFELFDSLILSGDVNIAVQGNILPVAGFLGGWSRVLKVLEALIMV